MTAAAIARRRFPIALALTAAICVGMQFPGRLDLSALALMIWLTALTVAARPLLRRLWYPRFYAFSGVLVLLSGLVLGEPDLALGPIALSSSGLRAGALMLVRGIQIFGLTVWAASLYTRGEMQAAVTAERAGWRLAIAVALRLVPDLAEKLHAAWRDRDRSGPRLARLETATVGLIRATADIAEGLTRQPSTSSPRRIAVSGPSGSGKTTTLRGLGRLLASRGLPAGGILQPVEHDGDRRRGYWLEDVATGERREFARRRTDSDRGFDFEPDGWGWAAQRIREARRDRALLIVDELGKVEAGGGGHLTALMEPAAGGRDRLWLCGVRHDALAEIERQLGPFELVLAPAPESADLDRYAQRIALLLRGPEVPP
ncbi:MAG: DUF2478 domain-containing protein [Deltaproteobacteria bacterium]|nr:DUF2478 domain-containing protein [Deltaproteobacteria bacterium]